MADSGIPNVLVYTSVSLLALFGFFVAARECRDNLIPLAIPLLFFPLVYYVTHADIRFRHPVDPEVVVFMAYGAATLFGERAKNISDAGNS